MASSLDLNPRKHWSGLAKKNMKYILSVFVLFVVCFPNCNGTKRQGRTFVKRLMKMDREPDFVILGEGVFSRERRAGGEVGIDPSVFYKMFNINLY